MAVTKLPPHHPPLGACRIVSWCIIYGIYWGLLWCTIFFAARNLQIHDDNPKPHHFGNMLVFFGFFLGLALIFGYCAAILDRTTFPSITFLVPIYLAIMAVLLRNDGYISLSYFILWLPLHFLLFYCWYLCGIQLQRQKNRNQRIKMKVAFLSLLLFYILLLLRLEGFLKVPFFIITIGFVALLGYCRLYVWYNNSIFPRSLVMLLESLQIVFFGFHISGTINWNWHFIVMPSYFLIAMDLAGRIVQLVIRNQQGKNKKKRKH